MAKQQFNIRLETSLVEALRSKAASEGTSITDLIARYVEQGLGLPAEGDRSANSEAIYNRIAARVEDLISLRVEERIAEQLAPLQNQVIQLNQSVEGRVIAQLTNHLTPLQEQVLDLSKCLVDNISTQLEPLQEELERFQERIEQRIAECVEGDDVLGESNA